MADPNEFSVIEFLPDDCWQYVAQGLDAETAVRTAKRCTEKPAAKLGIIKRVIITDGGDYTCFEWKHGAGVTYPNEHTVAYDR